MKKVSLLLMTYNCKESLISTLNSIEQQDYPEIELVISDSASTDGTVEIIKKAASNSKYEYNWVSEKDTGLYNALNKDIKRATGDYLMVMNDQLMKTDAISKLVRALETGDYVGSHCDLIYADDKKVIRYWKMKNGSIYSGWLPGHPTLMLKREVYQQFGLYDEELKSSADYEFMVRFLKEPNTRIAYVPELMVRMYYGGTSTAGLGTYLVSLKEGHRALAKNHVHPAFLIDLLRTFRVLFQFSAAKKADPYYSAFLTTQKKWGVFL